MRGKHQKGSFTILLAVFLLVLLAGGAFYYLSTKTSSLDTENPEVSQEEDLPAQEVATYEGEFYHFQYPSNWELIKSDKNSVTLERNEMLEARGAYLAQKANVTLSVTSKDISSSTTLDSWLEDLYLRNDDTTLFSITKELAEKTTLGGADALSIQVPGGAGYLDSGTIAIYKNRGYAVSISGIELEGAYDAYKTVTSSFTFNY